MATEMETRTLRSALGKVVGWQEEPPHSEWSRDLQEIMEPCRRPESGNQVSVQEASLP